MSGKYVLHAAGKDEFHWDLKSANMETILSSELYTAKKSAEGGIEACRANSDATAHYGRLTSKNNQPYFVLKAANGEVIGTSQMYGSGEARDHGINSCRKFGPSAVIQDDTK